MNRRISTLIVLLLGIATGIVQAMAATQEHAPILTSVYRTSPYEVIAGTQLTFNYSIQLTSTSIYSTEVFFTGPDGVTREAIQYGKASGTAMALTAFNWPAGQYTATRVRLRDGAIGRNTDYNRDGTITNTVVQSQFDFPTFIGATVHSFDLATLDFKIIAATGGTAVSGAISGDTSWTATGSPYRLTGKVQIPSGVTLTIGPGARVIGNAETLEIFGHLVVAGTAANSASNPILSNVIVTPGLNSASAPFSIDIQFATIAGGLICPAPVDRSYGTVNIRDSLLLGVVGDPSFSVSASHINLFYPIGDCAIERNVFYQSCGIVIGTGGGYSPAVSIRNNVFFGPNFMVQATPNSTDAVITSFAQSSGSIAVTGNSILGVITGFDSFTGLYNGCYALALASGAPAAALAAPGNYWGSLTDLQVDALVLDQSLKPGLAGTIPVLPRLAAPDPGTPAVPASPTFTQQPASSQVVSLGGSATLTAAASSSVGVSFQWQKDGITLAGSTAATLTLSNIGLRDLGTYTVTATTAFGQTTSAPATVTLGGAADAAWLSNVSVRTAIQPGQEPLVVGFATNGPKPILVRAAGPALAVYGVSNPLADPSLAVYPSGADTPLASNDDWQPALAEMFTQVAAFPFALGSNDAALVQTLNGTDSAVELTTGSGIVLVEAYDLNSGAGTNRLVNVSARNTVGSGDDILIAGFAVHGSGTKRLLIRGIGPRLAELGVGKALVDPKLEIYDAANTRLAANDNWDASLASAFSAAGAFDLTPGSKDAALVLELAAGQTYTVHLSSTDGTVGVGLIEIYEAP